MRPPLQHKLYFGFWVCLCRRRRSSYQKKAPQYVQLHVGAPRFRGSKIVPMKQNTNGYISGTLNFVWKEKRMDAIQNKKRIGNLRYYEVQGDLLLCFANGWEDEGFKTCEFDARAELVSCFVEKTGKRAQTSPHGIHVCSMDCMTNKKIYHLNLQ
jgi:hypothetical protein